MSPLQFTDDKHGQQVTVGDDVHLVYGGVGHHMIVERISVHPETRLVQVHGSITVSVPATTTTRIDEHEALLGPQSAQDEAEDPDPTSTTPKSKNGSKKEK